MEKEFGTKQYSDTDVEEVKRLNANSGLSYNEALQLLAKQYNEQKKQE